MPANLQICHPERSEAESKDLFSRFFVAAFLRMTEGENAAPKDGYGNPSIFLLHCRGIACIIQLGLLYGSPRAKSRDRKKENA